MLARNATREIGRATSRSTSRKFVSDLIRRFQLFPQRIGGLITPPSIVPLTVPAWPYCAIPVRRSPTAVLHNQARGRRAGLRRDQAVEVRGEV